VPRLRNATLGGSERFNGRVCHAHRILLVETPTDVRMIAQRRVPVLLREVWLQRRRSRAQEQRLAFEEVDGSCVDFEDLRGTVNRGLQHDAELARGRECFAHPQQR